MPFVRDGLDARSLYFSADDVQSRMRLRRPDALELRYTRTMMGFLLFAPQPADVLMVGLGGGSLAKFCHRHLPRTRLRVIEVNPHVIALRDLFRVPPDSARFQVIEADAAAYLAAAPARCDVLLLDAFGPQGLPRALSRPRFYDDCADVLRPGGVLVANFHSAAPDRADCIERLGRSFGGHCHAVDAAGAVNTIVFGRKGVAIAAPAPAAVACPPKLDATARAQLAPEFERIVSGLRASPPAAARHG